MNDTLQSISTRLNLLSVLHNANKSHLTIAELSALSALSRNVSDQMIEEIDALNDATIGACNEVAGIA